MRSSPLALAVLGLLMAGPMHPYGMQRLLRQWGKDQVINVGQRANLYKTIRRLHEAGLIAVRQTERDQLYPERTVYELTEAGQQAAGEWLDDMLAVPRPEYPPFPAALSFAMLAGPDGLRDALERRAAAVGRQLAALDADLERYSAGLPRVTLLDDEYRRAVLAAELSWLDGLVDALRSGALTWTREDLAGLATAELAEAGISAPESDRWIGAEPTP
jgi:DNA-binding PadR family transcriptional regulator